MLKPTDLNENRNYKYKLSILRVVKKLVPITTTLPIVRAALGMILMFLLLMANELAGAVGLAFVFILFAIGMSAPLWLTRKKHQPREDMMKR